MTASLSGSNIILTKGDYRTVLPATDGPLYKRVRALQKSDVFTTTEDNDRELWLHFRVPVSGVFAHIYLEYETLDGSYSGAKQVYYTSEEVLPKAVPSEVLTWSASDPAWYIRLSRVEFCTGSVVEQIS